MWKNDNYLSWLRRRLNGYNCLKIEMKQEDERNKIHDTDSGNDRLQRGL